MKFIITSIFYFALINVVLASSKIEELKVKLKKANSNAAMKIASADLNFAYRDEIKRLENQLRKKLGKKQLEAFQKSSRAWKSLYDKEANFLVSEFDGSQRYGTNASLVVKSIKREILKGHYNYLVSLSKNIFK